ncbi:MAG: redoxin family protein [Candidatus Eremiobacteraeota bacterium]|nr:redoxin family protein [Candidatus Eremiobacteraeota bacterium]
MTDPPKRRFFTVGRVWDALALLVVAFVIWKLFVAPRTLKAAAAYPAPHVRYEALQGAPFVMSAHKGRVVFLDFYASWCEPCKLSLPLVEKFARTHPEVDVVPVDVGEPRPIVEAFARRYDLAHVAMDPSAISQGFFQIDGFPTMVVIDPGGKIRATWTGFNPAVQLNMANAAKQLRPPTRTAI